MAREVRAWTPFREMDRFSREFDDLLDRFWGGRGPHRREADQIPALESYIEGDNLVIRADLPGVDPKDVEITVTGDELRISGKREATSEEKSRDFYHREVRYGRFERIVRLPEGVKSEAIKASFRNGVLELSARIPEQNRTRKVPIDIALKS